MASSHSSSHSSSSSSRRSNLNIHKIREFELEKVYQVFQLKFSSFILNSAILLTQVHLMDEFDILQIVGEGWFGKILLVEHKATDTEMVLKGILFALNILIALSVQEFHSIHFNIYFIFSVTKTLRLNTRLLSGISFRTVLGISQKYCDHL